MRKRFGVRGLMAAVGVAAVAAMSLAFAPAIAAADSNEVNKADVSPAAPADGTPEGAIQWYQEREGSAEYEGYCQMAAENAYGTTGVWPSAIDHWYGAIEAGEAHEGDRNPPLGAFVFWNTSQYGHVGVADGEGGYWATSVGGVIGYSNDLDYYVNYLGWSEPKVPAGSSVPAGVEQR